jgi:electron transport complex protein RnfC
MLEKGEEIIVGTKILMKALAVEKAIIGIENNKPDAIEHMTKLCENNLGIQVYPLKVHYPQGGEKQLIKACINREVPSGGLPIDVGTVVHNVETAFAVYEAVQKNKPLFERVVSVTGKNLKKPSNFLVRVGTPVSEVIEAAGGLPGDTGKVVNGGPMMGKAIHSIDVPVTKGTSGILLFSENESKRDEVLNCIRCSKCASACPMGLEPYLLMPMAERKMWENLESEKVLDCMECGSCSFTCPSKRPLLDFIRYGKANILRIKREKQK